MNSVLLRLRAVQTPDRFPLVHWDLDCPTRGVVIMDVEAGSASAAPLHWRAGDWTKPPLDLRISDQGIVESIQFVFQDEQVEAAEIVIPSEPEPGLPVFDVHGWPQDRYLDAQVAVKTMRLPSGELYATIGEDDRAERFISVAGRLRFGVRSTGHLAAIAIGPLTRDEWQMIDAARP